MSIDWRPLPGGLDRPPDELDLAGPPVGERRRTAALVSSLLAVPVLVAALALALADAEPATTQASGVVAPVTLGAAVPPAASPPPGPLPTPADARPVDGTGVPARVLEAYRGAERVLGDTAPGCRLSWSLVAAIGRVESDHAGGGAVDVDGRTLTPIRGPRLDGTAGHPFLVDTDAGRLDGDAGVDLAVGPMQFLPSSWAMYGGGDIDDVDDAAVASGRHLCAGGVDLADPAQRAAAVFDYNRSDAYVTQVLALEAAYAAGTSAPVTMPALPPTLPPDPAAVAVAETGPLAPPDTGPKAPTVPTPSAPAATPQATGSTAPPETPDDEPPPETPDDEPPAASRPRPPATPAPATPPPATPPPATPPPATPPPVTPTPGATPAPASPSPSPAP